LFWQVAKANKKRDRNTLSDVYNIIMAHIVRNDRLFFIMVLQYCFVQTLSGAWNVYLFCYCNVEGGVVYVLCVPVLEKDKYSKSCIILIEHWCCGFDWTFWIILKSYSRKIQQVVFVFGFLKCPNIWALTEILVGSISWHRNNILLNYYNSEQHICLLFL